MNEKYIPLYVIYHCDEINKIFEPFQYVRGICNFYLDEKEAKKQLKKITSYPEHYRIVEYCKSDDVGWAQY